MTLRRGVQLGALALVTLTRGYAQRLELAWPTPNPAWLEGKPIQAYVQPTVSGDPTSGCFGCVRSDGTQFHEGVDLKPLKRDRHGEPADAVYAALPGIVRHINKRAGESSYGRYIVIEHPDVTPAVYSLYAHLASIAPGLSQGDHVERGQSIAQMGRSAGGYTIPRDRAHLHFEFGVMVTRDFQSWYNARKFGSPNDHGPWNGMNLMGIDPLDFLNAFRAKQVDTFAQYFEHLPPAATLRISTLKVPDFTARYPSLLTKAPEGLVAGWEISVTPTGLPFRWTPLSAMDVIGYTPNEVRIISYDQPLLRKNRCKSLVVVRNGKTAVGRDLETVLQQLFGLR